MTEPLTREDLRRAFDELNKHSFPSLNRVVDVVEDEHGAVHLVTSAGNPVLSMPRDVYEDLLVYQHKRISVPTSYRAHLSPAQFLGDLRSLKGHLK